MNDTSQNALSKLAEIAATSRHVSDFTAMFSVDAPVEALDLNDDQLDAYLSDAKLAHRRNS
jgi:hypothetical protein